MDYIKSFAAAFLPPSHLNLKEVYDAFGLKPSDRDSLIDMRNNPDDGLGKIDEDRLQKLQEKLEDNQFLYLDKSGSWPGEYVARGQEYLWWLTGFSGSAGSAIIGKNQAVLFSDSRYIIQAKKQAYHMDFFDIAEKTPLQWFTENANESHEIFVNGWTTATDFYHKLQKQSEAKLTALDDFSLMNDLWPNRLPLPSSPIWQHKLNHAGQSSEEKIAHYQKALSENNLDAYLITQPENIAWLLNIRSADIEHTPIPLSFAMVWKNGHVDWYMDKRRLTQKLQSHLQNFVSFYPPSHLHALNLKEYNIGYNADTTVISLYNQLPHGHKNMQDPCLWPKSIKNCIEQDGMINAHILDGLAMVRFLYWLEQEVPKGYVSECLAAEKLSQIRFANSSCLSLSFDTISASGPNAALPHYHPMEESDRKLSVDEIYLIDSGGQYQSGTTDITRTLKLGEATAEEKKAYTLVLKGFIDLFNHQFSESEKGQKLDAIARRPLNEYDMDFGHGTGHGVGCYLGVHEGPQSISPRNDHTGFKNGMICSIEPGYYKEGDFGIRIENLAIIRPIGEQSYFHNITYCPIDTSLIDFSLLTAHQKNWLNDYHQKVYDNLMPLLSGDENVKAWLKKATEKV